ncbi:MAG TPA: adenylate/guanylate cyclase domain-containing protein [Terriglobales bacterium]|nr:adenylate/guanylate cyclase domain-containing protein [Terriglobales bacterium]
MAVNEGVTKILNLTAEQMDRAAELDKLRRNITVLFTDLKGSTSYFEKYGDSAGLLMVHRCNTMLAEAVERHGGRVIKTIGDAVMAAFEDNAEAIAASIEMQEAIAADNAGKTGAEKISIRIGINYGLGIVKSNDVFGDVVNVASRVEGAASPEQILISHSLYEAVAGNSRFRIRPFGTFALKGKSKELELFEVQWKSGEAPPPVAVHSMIMPVLDFSQQSKIRLAQVRTDGQTAREFDVSGQATIGRTQGDFTFPHDTQMQPQHCRLNVEVGQLWAAPLDQAPVFFSLIGSYRLEQGDIVKIGNQMFEFRVNQAALEMGNVLGAGVGELSLLLQHPIAEFVSMGADQKHYSVLEGQTTWGRTKATYTFPTDTAMSRTHAKVYHRGEDFFIEDMGSTNGTFVMAREETPVPQGAILSIGGQRLKVLPQPQ